MYAYCGEGGVEWVVDRWMVLGNTVISHDIVNWKMMVRKNKCSHCDLLSSQKKLSQYFLFQSVVNMSY